MKLNTKTSLIGILLTIVWLLLPNILYSFNIDLQKLLGQNGNLYISHLFQYYILAVAVGITYFKGGNLKTLGLKKPKSFNIKYGLKLLFFMFLLNGFYNVFLFKYGIKTQAEHLMPEFAQMTNKVLLVFNAVVAAPICEEIFFRGFLLKGFQNSCVCTFCCRSADESKKLYNNTNFLNPPSASKTALNTEVLGKNSKCQKSFIKAAIVVSLFFALMHQIPSSMPPIFMLSIVFSLMYKKTGSIYTGILLHALVNGVGMWRCF